MKLCKRKQRRMVKKWSSGRVKRTETMFKSVKSRPKQLGTLEKVKKEEELESDRSELRRRRLQVEVEGREKQGEYCSRQTRRKKKKVAQTNVTKGEGKKWVVYLVTQTVPFHTF